MGERAASLGAGALAGKPEMRFTGQGADNRQSFGEKAVPPGDLLQTVAVKDGVL